VGTGDRREVEAMMAKDAPKNEKELRDELDRNADNVIVEGSGQAVAPRRLGHMVSLRLEPELAAALRELADRQGKTVSELLREGAAALLEDERASTRSIYSYVVFGANSLVARTGSRLLELEPQS
jgi:predicted DNA-binding ribbon-helix-helix protein